MLLKCRDILITQLAVLSAMRLAAESMGSRGSGLVTKADGVPVSDLLDIRYVEKRNLQQNSKIITRKIGEKFISEFNPVNPLPKPDSWFENVWSDYRRRTKNIFGH